MAENPQKPSDRQKVLEWLSRIGETDPVAISEVIELCSKDLDARRFYVGLHDKLVAESNIT